MKQLSYRDFRSILLVNGYKEVRTKGDHVIYSDGNGIVSINKRKPNQMVIRRLIKANALKV